MNLKTLSNHAWTLTLCLLASYAVMMVPVDALATGAGGTQIANTVCAVINWMTGDLGTAIATLAIIVIGVGALMGKVSWGMAIIVGLGVAVIFGSGTIAQSLGADALNCP